jgi:hypothetical protein
MNATGIRNFVQAERERARKLVAAANRKRGTSDGNGLNKRQGVFDFPITNTEVNPFVSHVTSNNIIIPGFLYCFDRNRCWHL